MVDNNRKAAWGLEFLRIASFWASLTAGLAVGLAALMGPLWLVDGALHDTIYEAGGSANNLQYVAFVFALVWVFVCVALGFKVYDHLLAFLRRLIEAAREE